MAIVVPVACVVGQIAESEDLSVPRGTDLILDLTLTTSSGVPHNGAGGRVVAGWWRPGWSTPQGNPVLGRSDGRYRITMIPGDRTAILDGLLQWDAWFISATGAREQLKAPGSVNVTAVVGPIVDAREEPAPIPEPAVVTPPQVQETIALTGVLDLSYGAATPIPFGTAVRSEFGSALGASCAVAVPVGTVRDESAVAEIRVGHLVGSVWTPVASWTLTQSATVAWTFEGRAGIPQRLALTSGAYQYQVWLRRTGFAASLVVDVGELVVVPGSGTVDAPPPVVSLSGPVAGTYDDAELTVSGTVTAGDGLSLEAVELRDGPNTLWSWTRQPNTTSLVVSRPMSLAIGSHSLTLVARDDVGQPTTSPALSITIASQSPSGTVSAPAADSELTIGSVVQITATWTHPGGAGEIASVVYRVDGAGAWVAMPLISGSTYRADYVVTGEPGATTFEVRASDRTPTAVTLTRTATRVLPIVAWGTTYAYSANAARMTAPSSGDLTIALDPTLAADGAILDLTVPAGPTSFAITTIAGWRLEADIAVDLGGVTLDGGYSWQGGDAWRVLLEVDVPTQTIRWSARRTVVAMALPIHWSLAGNALATVGGVALPASNGVAVDTPAFVANPRGSGQVAQAGAGAFTLPVGGALDARNGYTIAFDVYCTQQPLNGVVLSDTRAWGGDDGNADFALFLGLGTTRPQVYGSGDTPTPDPVGHALEYGYWEKVVWVHDADGVNSRIYKNGIFVTAVARSQTAPNNSTSMTVLAGALGDRGRSPYIYVRNVMVQRGAAWSLTGGVAAFERLVALLSGVNNAWRIGSSLQQRSTYWHDNFLLAFPGVTDVSRTTGIFANNGMAIAGASLTDMLGTEYPQMRIFHADGNPADLAWVDFGGVVNTFFATGWPGDAAFNAELLRCHNELVMPLRNRCRRVWVMRFGRANPSDAGLAWVRDNAAPAIRAFQDAHYGTSSNVNFGIIDWMTVLGANPGADYEVDNIGVHPTTAGIDKLLIEMARQAHLAF